MYFEEYENVPQSGTFLNRNRLLASKTTARDTVKLSPFPVITQYIKTKNLFRTIKSIYIKTV